MRRAFNFYRSYWEVLEQLPEKEQLAYLKAIIHRQFTGEEIDLEGMAKFAYISQKHSIDSQIQGYESKVKRTLQEEYKGSRQAPSVGGRQGGSQAPSVQEKEKEKEKVQYVEEFERFWSKYPKKVAKDKCKDKFLKLKESEIETILNTIDKYINYKPFEDYTHPNPLTYLNQRRWEDEIPEEEKKPKTGADIYAENVMRQINANK